MHNTNRKFRWAILLVVMTGVSAIADENTIARVDEVLAIPARQDLSALIQQPSTTANQQQHDSFALLTDALASASFSEAESAAKQMVEQVNVDTMDAASARARALHNLAIAQQFLGSHDSAIQNYTAALDIIAGEDGNLSSSLILPLRGLAIAHLDKGQPDIAFAKLDRAQHVSDVNFGPHSFEQLPILNSKMQAYLDNNDQGSALEMLDRMYMLYSRKFSRKSQELLPALYQKAEIYKKLEMDVQEFRAWRHILEIKRGQYAENDTALIEPNIRLAAIRTRELRKYGYRRVTTSSAEKYLKKALRIAESSPDNNWEVKRDCLLSIADFYTLFDLKARARRYYSAAWDLLSSNEMSLDARTEYFEAPVPLARPKFDPYANFEYNPNRQEIDPSEYLVGEITVGFTVDDRGRTRDLRIIAADPPNFSQMEKRVRNAVEEFVYRPRYVEGKAAAASDQRYRASYFYVPSEYQASIAKSANPDRRRRTRNP